MAITCFKENKVNYLRKLLLWKMYVLEVAAFPYGEVATWEIVIWENVHLGSCRLENCTFGKLHLGNTLGKRPLVKYLTLYCRYIDIIILFVSFAVRK